MSDEIQIIDHSDRVEQLFDPFREALGGDFEAYRGHVYRTITYAMHILGNDERHRKMIETVFVYHDIGLWTDRELAYLEPSEEIALRDNKALGLGLDPDILREAIHWHHKITPYPGKHADIVEAVRRADWIDATEGRMRKGLSKTQVRAVRHGVPDPGFTGVLMRLAKELGGNVVSGNLRVLRRVFKF